MQQIAEWLERLGLSEYAQRFNDNAIDLSVIRDLTEQDLKDLGVLLGHRRKILRAVAELDRVAPASIETADEPMLRDEAERRHLTVMICDLVGSTALSARLDPEDMRAVIDAYHATCARITRTYDGFLAEFRGDGILAYFGYPRAHEDDAERTVRAGLDIIASVAQLQTRAAEPLAVRIGIATGLVVVGDPSGMDALRVPLLNPDFSPFLQRVRDAAPDGVFVFIPAGQAATMMRQFVERGLDKSGIRLFGAGDITDDDLLNNMGDVALGIETAYFYSAAHASEKNKAFVEGVKRANTGMRANFFGVSGYDGMHLIYEAIRKTGGKTDGDSFIGAVKGMSWESPRGPMTIDPETRDVISNIYMRRVERVNGELWNIEFATVENVKDPVKAARN